MIKASIRPLRSVNRQACRWAAMLIVAAGGTAQAATWNYVGNEGPKHWGDLDPAYKICSSGAEQSPIDLSGRIIPAAPESMSIEWAPGPIHVVNNGHTIEAEVPAGSSITIDGQKLRLRQFHFHLPSEHTRNGQHAAMEAHFVHADSNGKSAVLAVMLTPGAANPLFHAIMAAAPKTSGDPEHEIKADIRTLLPKSLARYRYEGSLTTPPCFEIIDWQLLSNAVTVDAQDIETFRNLIGENARPVQPQGRRFVLKVPS